MFRSDNSKIRSRVIDSLQDLVLKEERMAVVYFYWEIGLQQEQTAVQFVSALLKQLAQTNSIILPGLASLYTRSSLQNSNPEQQDLPQIAEFFFQMCGSKEVFIVIDALDECPTAALEDVLRFINDCRSRPHIMIIATCRSSWLAKVLASLHKVIVHEIPEVAIQTDIELFITERLKGLEAKGVTEGLESEIRKYAAQDADAMYRLTPTS